MHLLNEDIKCKPVEEDGCKDHFQDGRFKTQILYGELFFVQFNLT
ncbi:hypothetical protein [Pseudoalteromonas luteoviolacea]|uniref:Uncharacterized protein n=2 Tax=Pseudoalteromonas luteoviolacea TaxID=43657 RepID=A0A0F6AC21_9GAMM|nr:hypothetical protein [Pseudoalteromonas luteoviolacea]KKE83730.1 hypothetical protein N479_12955 [Pseudoalteromonas luteoviolacea S4054]KZN71934.1 hypothetical protein N481_17320 [Pseudoalteromonas luteoviolacea S4047-1]